MMTTVFTRLKNVFSLSKPQIIMCMKIVATKWSSRSKVTKTGREIPASNKCVAVTTEGNQLAAVELVLLSIK